MTSALVDTHTSVETPENVTLTFDLAGPGSRMGAYLVDLLLRLAVLWGVSAILPLISAVFGQGLPLGMMLILMFLLEWGYGAFFEGLLGGRTPGKRIFHLRVIKTAGYPIGFHDAVLRNFLRSADILPIGYGVGLLCMLSTRQMQRIGDLVAGTIVVREDVHKLRRHLEAYRDLEPLTRREAPQHFTVPERTLDVIEQLLARQGELGRRRIEEIALLLAGPLAARMGYDLNRSPGPDPALFFLKRVLRTCSTLPDASGARSAGRLVEDRILSAEEVFAEELPAIDTGKQQAAVSDDVFERPALSDSSPFIEKSVPTADVAPTSPPDRSPEVSP